MAALQFRPIRSPRRLRQAARRPLHRGERAQRPPSRRSRQQRSGAGGVDAAHPA